MQIILEPKFERDFKTLSKKHYDVSKVVDVYIMLSNNITLPPKYKNHYLQGDLQGYQECHIDKYILLIYQIIDNDLILCRLGSHKDLLGK